MNKIRIIISLISLFGLSIELLPTPENKKIILDCDPGVDDALAIILAVNSNVLDIQAITTVAGNSSVQDTTANAIYILHMLPTLAWKQKTAPQKAK